MFGALARLAQLRGRWDSPTSTSCPTRSGCGPASSWGRSSAASAVTARGRGAQAADRVFSQEEHPPLRLHALVAWQQCHPAPFLCAMPSGQEEQDAVVAAALAADAPPQAALWESAAAAPGLERWYRCWSEGCSRRTLSPIRIAQDCPHFVCSMDCYNRATLQWIEVQLDLEEMDRQMGDASHSAAMPAEPRPPAAPHYAGLCGCAMWLGF